MEKIALFNLTKLFIHKTLIRYINDFFFLAKYMYDIQEYSFSQTTLEQVYLKFAHYENTAEALDSNAYNVNVMNC